MTNNRKLYVGSLAYSVNDEILKNLFAAVGSVESAKVITDFNTGRSKGFGFVEMATDEEAEKAIRELNGSTHEGRTLIVSAARPPERNGGGSGRNSRGGGGGRFNNNRGGGHGRHERHHSTENY